MDNDKVAEFAARYRHFNQWALAELDAKSTLTEEARFALDAVIAERGIDLDKLRNAAAAEESEQAQLERARTE